MRGVFFVATQKALDNVTGTFEFVWPITASLWHMRREVIQAIDCDSAITDAELYGRYCADMGINVNGVPFRNALYGAKWESQLKELAWILLNATISLFEGWLNELKENIFPDLDEKKMQFPDSIRNEVNRLTQDESSVMKSCFYNQYSKKAHRCFGKIENLMRCFRVFKEARNCYMHNGRCANDKLVEEYRQYTTLQPNDLDIPETLDFIPPISGEEIEMCLRGVVGFSSVVIKIITSIDTELLCSKRAETEFDARFKEKNTPMRTLATDSRAARGMVKRYSKQAGFTDPENLQELKQYLLNKNLVSL